MRDYQPRTRPLIPVGHDTWLAVSRVPRREVKDMSDLTPDEYIEQMLRWVTAPGADCSQRHDDLITLAEFIIKTRGNKVPIGPHSHTYDGDSSFGYGVTPIDSDTHDGDCKVCGNAKVYDNGGHDVDFDRHPYEMGQGTCDIHEGVHDFVNGEHYCRGWLSYHPDEVTA